MTSWLRICPASSGVVVCFRRLTRALVVPQTLPACSVTEIMTSLNQAAVAQLVLLVDERHQALLACSIIIIIINIKLPN
jgi:hypothetical protein